MIVSPPSPLLLAAVAAYAVNGYEDHQTLPSPPSSSAPFLR
jgi:hypothetical protein